MNSNILENKIQVNFSSENEKKEYTNFLLNNSDSNIYHTIEWKEVLEKYFNFDPYYLIARNNENQIKAILPLFYLKNLCGKRLDSIPFSTYGGVLGNDRYVEFLVKKIFEINDKLKCKYIIIRQHPTRYSELFEQIGMKKIVDRWNHMLPIKDPKELWNEIDKSNRNSIRQAINHNVKVELISDIDTLSDFYEMEFLTRKKFGDPTPHISFYQTIWKKMRKKGYVKVFIAKYNSVSIASSMIFNFNNNVVYAFANSDPKYLKLRPNNLILWKIIEWSFNKGCSSLDMGSTLIGSKGLFSFKSSFNPVNIQYAHFYYPGDSILIKDTFLGKVGKKFVEKTPAVILKPICPFLIKKFV